jgi:hypothetical protein
LKKIEESKALSYSRIRYVLKGNFLSWRIERGISKNYRPSSPDFTPLDIENWGHGRFYMKILRHY